MSHADHMNQSAQTPEDSLDFLKEVIEALEEGVALFDARLQFVLCNQKYLDLACAPDVAFPKKGEGSDVIARRQFASGAFVLPEGTDLSDIVGSTLDAVRMLKSGVESQRSDGRVISASSRKTNQGGFLVTVMDITERRKVEEAERRSGELLRTVIEACPANFLMSRAATGEVLYRSVASKDLFGEQVSAKSHWTNPADRETYLASLERDGRVDDMFVEGRNAKGEMFPSQVSARLIRYQDEDVIVSSTTDLTEAFTLRGERDKANARLRDAVEALEEGFVLYDEEHRFVLSNSRYADMLGPHRKNLKPGTHMSDIIGPALAGGYISMVRAPAGGMEGLLATLHEQKTLKVEIKVADGTQREITLGKLADGGIVATVLDITHQRTAEAWAREMLSDAIEAVDFGVALVDDSERLVFANQKFREIGDPNNNILVAGQKMRDIHSAAVDTGLFPTLPGLSKIDLLDHLDAQIRDSAKGFPVPNNHNSEIVGSIYETSFGGRLLTLNDVTEQRRTERLFADAVARLPVGVAIERADGRFSHCNDAFAGPFQRSAAELLELSPEERVDILAPKMATVNGRPTNGRAVAAFAEALEVQRRSLRPMEVSMLDGHHYLVERADTQDKGRVVVVTDITALKEAEAKTLDAVTDAIQSLDEALVLFDHDLKFVMANKRWYEIFFSDNRLPDMGESARDLMLRLMNAGFYMLPDGMDAQEFEKRMIDALRNYSKRVPLALTDGRFLLASSHKTGLGGFLVSCTDVTEQHRAEEELERQREISHQNEKLSALGELLAGVAHELNNPLSIVVGYAQMLQGKVKDPVLEKRVDRIAQAADRSAKIVKTFLAMARQRPAKIETCSLNELATIALEVAGYGLRANGVKISLDLDPHLPPVSGDPDQLIQVFTNLIVNAEHAVAAHGALGNLTIRSYQDPQKEQAVVEIRDNGAGIPMDMQARIFEPFFTTKDVGDGTGVGLAFCHRIIATHGGALDLKSVPGRGTVFFVRLDVFKSATEVVSEVPSILNSSQNLRVLVVDDEPDIGELIQDILAEVGYKTAKTVSAEDALRQLQSDQFDLIISDFKMPGIDGAGFYGLLMDQMPHLADRVLFITGDSMSSKSTAFFEESNRPYLEKPIVAGELIRKIDELIGGKGEVTQ